MSESAYIIDRRESERISILKFWFCLLVVFIHAAHLDGFNFSEGTIQTNIPFWLESVKIIISKIIAHCAVPGFFFVSGMLLFRKEFSWAENVRRKLRTLIVPYLFLNTFWIAVFFVAQCIPLTKPFFSQPINVIKSWRPYDWLNAYLGICRVKDLAQPFLVPTWFLRDLFILNLIAPALKRVINRFPRLVLAVLGAMLIFNIETHLFFLGRDALVFFCLGYYFVKRGLHFSDVDSTPPMIIIIPFIISVAGMFFLDGYINSLAEVLVKVFGILFFIRFLTDIKSERWREQLLGLACYSTSIYLFHEMSLSTFQKLEMRIFPDTLPFQLISYFGTAIFIVFYCVAISKFLERFQPGLYSLITGGRSKRKH